MSQENQGQTNEFGTVVQPSAEPQNLNQQGKETTLDDILAAIQAREGKEANVPPAGGPAVKPPVDMFGGAGEQQGAPKAGDPVVSADIDTGSKALDIAVRSFMKSTGATDADIQRATAKAIEYGDANLIDKAFLAEKFGDRADEAASIAEAVLEQMQVGRERLVQDVYALAGGKDAWDQSLAVYKQHAPAGLQKVIKAMFDSGDSAAVKEAAGLVAEFAKHSGAISVTGNRVQGSGAAVTNGLSADEFKQAVTKLNPSSRTYAQDYAKLIDMRRAGKQAGR